MGNVLHSPFVQWLLKKALGSPKATAAITFVITQGVALLVAKLHLSQIMPADSLALIVKTLTENSIESGIALQAVFYAKVMQWTKQSVTAAQVAYNESETQAGANVRVKEDGVPANEFVKASAKIAEVPLQDVVEAVKPPRALPVDA